MIRALYAGALLLSCVLLTPPARACNVESYEPTDIDYAQMVVVGEVKNYRVVPNDALSEQIRKCIEVGTAPDWQQKRYFEDIASGTSPGGYYGRFEIAVDKVLKGRAGKTLSVTLADWIIPHVGDDSSRLPKHLASKRYLIALNMPDAESAIGHSADSQLLTVHMNYCLGPFMGHPGFEAAIESYQQWLREQGRKHPSH